MWEPGCIDCLCDRNRWPADGVGKGAFHYVTFSLFLDFEPLPYIVYSKVKYVKFINEIHVFLAPIFANGVMPTTILLS